MSSTSDQDSYNYTERNSSFKYNTTIFSPAPESLGLCSVISVGIAVAWACLAIPCQLRNRRFTDVRFLNMANVCVANAAWLVAAAAYMLEVRHELSYVYELVYSVFDLARLIGLLCIWFWVSQPSALSGHRLVMRKVLFVTMPWIVATIVILIVYNQFFYAFFASTETPYLHFFALVHISYSHIVLYVLFCATAINHLISKNRNTCSENLPRISSGAVLADAIVIFAFGLATLPFALYNAVISMCRNVSGDCALHVDINVWYLLVALRLVGTAIAPCCWAADPGIQKDLHSFMSCQAMPNRRDNDNEHEVRLNLNPVATRVDVD